MASIPSKISLDNAKKNKLFYVVGNVIVYRESDGRCLILKRSERETAHPGMFGIVGGKLEWNDLNLAHPTRMNGIIPNFEHALEDLMIREVKEEAGIEIEHDFHYIGNIAFVRPDETPVLLINFAAKYKSGDVVLEEGSFTEFAWVTSEEAKKYPCLKGIPEEIAQATEIFKSQKS